MSIIGGLAATLFQDWMARRAVVRDRAEAAAGEILDLLDQVEALADDVLFDRTRRDYDDRIRLIIMGVQRHLLDLTDAEVRRRLEFVVEILTYADSMYLPGETYTVLRVAVREAQNVLGAYRRREEPPAELAILARHREGLALMAEMDEEIARAQEEDARREREERQDRHDHGQDG
ncbi:hypothetical protein ACG83_10250 [Frankia sp. R43]|uniref:hypothetical protein n=1 Tax=Frankia sp. R43 TaxID=269536 RepID=UPI0006CA23C7|nr:hypothetical protein [Frankia sp. R43]KPM55662.1 hypothetical protein ACG83_10250 [Frankia sp. R43]